MAVKLFKKKNDASILETWGPVIDSQAKMTVDAGRKAWLAEYCHYHAIFDNSGGALNEAAIAPGLFYQQPGSISAMGNPIAPTPSQTPLGAGAGSGDKFPSLLPVAIQVAAKTIAFDLVPVVPMDTPVGFLPYLDYVYQGGNLTTQFEPFLIKIDLITGQTVVPSIGGTVTSGDYSFIYIGNSRIDANPIFKVITGSDSTSTTVVSGLQAAQASLVASPGTIATSAVELVSALENHISGFTTSSDNSYATDTWSGPFQPTTGTVPVGMQRADAEVSRYRQMGLRMFTKFVEARGDQVAISATVEQIQDLNRVWNYDVVSMLENVATNELAQSINKQLMDRMFILGTTHATKIAAAEGVNVASLTLTAGGGFENTSTLQRRFVTRILELANLIYHRGRFGPGTYIVTNGRIASALADVAGYQLAPFNNDLASTAGQLYPVGKVYGLTVYVDPNMSWSDVRVLIGRKGADEEPGVKFMPYIMAESLQTISEGTMSPKIAMKSRYAIVEAGWHPETQYITLTLGSADVDRLVGAAPAIA